MTGDKLTPFQQELLDAARQYAYDDHVLGMYIQSENELITEAHKNVTESETKFRALVARATDLDRQKMIYKHQCGHCKRFSPLPFLVHEESYERWRKHNDEIS